MNPPVAGASRTECTRAQEEDGMVCQLPLAGRGRTVCANGGTAACVIAVRGPWVAASDEPASERVSGDL